MDGDAERCLEETELNGLTNWRWFRSEKDEKKIGLENRKGGVENEISEFTVPIGFFLKCKLIEGRRRVIAIEGKRPTPLRG